MGKTFLISPLKMISKHMITFKKLQLVKEMNIELSNAQLNKLKLGIKTGTELTLKSS